VLHDDVASPTAIIAIMIDFGDALLLLMAHSLDGALWEP
jgi:hypothetical protein